MTQQEIKAKVLSLIEELAEEIMYLLPENCSKNNCIKALINAQLHAAASFAQANVKNKIEEIKHENLQVPL
jgi:hypothetical protein